MKRREAKRKEREKAEKEKEKEDKKIADALAKVKWPLSEKQLDVLLDLVFLRFGFSYLQPVAKRHDIKPNITVRNGYKSRDIEKPLMEFAKKDGNAGRLRMIFEIGLEATGNREEILKKL